MGQKQNCKNAFFYYKGTIGLWLQEFSCRGDWLAKTFFSSSSFDHQLFSPPFHFLLSQEEKKAAFFLQKNKNFCKHSQAFFSRVVHHLLSSSVTSGRRNKCNQEIPLSLCAFHQDLMYFRAKECFAMTWASSVIEAKKWLLFLLPKKFLKGSSVLTTIYLHVGKDDDGFQYFHSSFLPLCCGIVFSTPCIARVENLSSHLLRPIHTFAAVQTQEATLGALISMHIGQKDLLAVYNGEKRDDIIKSVVIGEHKCIPPSVPE